MVGRAFVVFGGSLWARGSPWAQDEGVLQLETPRLILRPIVLADAVAFFRLNSDPEVYRYTREAPPASLAQVERRIDSYPDYSEYGFGRLACVLKGTEEMIGFCGLKRLPELDGAVDLGFRLARAHWGKGLATEAGYASLRFGFEELGLDRVIGLVEAANERSIHVLEKLGMVYEHDVEYFGDLCRQYAVTPARLRGPP